MNIINQFPKKQQPPMTTTPSSTSPTPSPNPSPAPARTQLQILLASTTSCIINMILINPLEVKKLRMQYSPITCPQWPHISFKQMNNCECTQISFREMFKGLSVSLFHALLSNTLYMQLYEYQRGMFLGSMGSGMATLSAAMLSRLMVTFVMNPIQAFRVRFINSTEKLGIKQSRASLKVTLVRDLSYSCLYWFTIEKIRNMLMGDEYRTHQGKKNVIYANIIPAAIAGSLVSIVTTPVDTIKTRLQSGVEMQGTLLNQLKSLYAKQGMHGLFSGVQFRVIRNTTSSVLYITLFEHIIEYLQRSGTGVRGLGH